jgi:hypothetical protein
MTEFSNNIQPPLPSLSEPSSIRSLRFDEESISSQKNCNPGPNVNFDNKIPYVKYLSNMEKPGTLGCKPDQYPKFTDGKYCCESTMATPQEQLDYVNMLLRSAIYNVNQTMFGRVQNIVWLKNQRNMLLEKYKNNKLTDTLLEEFPLTVDDETYENLDDYINKNIAKTGELEKDRLYRNSSIEGLGQDNVGRTRINTYVNKQPSKVEEKIKGGRTYKKTKKRYKKNIRNKKNKKSRRRNKRSTKK